MPRCQLTHRNKTRVSGQKVQHVFLFSEMNTSLTYASDKVLPYLVLHCYCQNNNFHFLFNWRIFPKITPARLGCFPQRSQKEPLETAEAGPGLLTVQMPHLSPIPQCQCTKGTWIKAVIK